ncbi:MAG: hypothetical protein RMY28_009440 [Nostoc sp. ChiSLP01]|nr:hypothetical protein [Nostoc sp. CmiSLP01]MDZ8285222.1 hypothetical protein [Nostoc sp. ChiSLP01]
MYSDRQLQKLFTITNMIAVSVPKGNARQTRKLKINGVDVEVTYLIDLKAGEAIALLTDKGNWYLVGEAQSINQFSRKIIEYRKTQPVTKEQVNIKILFSLINNEAITIDYYVGGDRAVPLLLFSRDFRDGSFEFPERVDAYITNLGRNKNQFAVSYFPSQRHEGVFDRDPYNRFVFNYYSGETNYFYTSNVEPDPNQGGQFPSQIIYRGDSLIINTPNTLLYGADFEVTRDYPVNAIHLNNKTENTSQYTQSVFSNGAIRLSAVNHSYNFIDNDFTYNTDASIESRNPALTSSYQIVYEQNISISNNDVFYKGISSIITEDININVYRKRELKIGGAKQTSVVTDNTIYKLNNSIILNRKPFIITVGFITETINKNTSNLTFFYAPDLILPLTEEVKASLINTEIYLGAVSEGITYLVEGIIEAFTLAFYFDVEYPVIILSVNKITAKKSLSFANLGGLGITLFSKNYSFLIPFILGVRRRNFDYFTELHLQSSYTITSESLSPQGFNFLPLVHAFNPELLRQFIGSRRDDFFFYCFQQTIKNISLLGNKIFYSYSKTINGKTRVFVEQWDIKDNGDVVFSEKIKEVPIKKLKSGAYIHSIQYLP